MPNTVVLLGVKVSRVNLDGAVTQILQWVRQKQQTYVCVAPAATLVDAKRSEEYRDVVNGAGMVTADGMPVVWLARLKGCADVARAYGPDLLRRVCDQGQEQGTKHFFYGATSETLRHLCQRLKAKNPRIKIVGSYAPPFYPTAQLEEKSVIEAINASGADIVWVGIGSPKQDLWLRLHRPCLTVPVMIAAGAAFDFVAGMKPQAPRWMGRSGLEWLFRLICEPRRLWKRYLVGNALFCWYALGELLRKEKR